MNNHTLPTNICAHCLYSFTQCTCEVEEVPLKYYVITLDFTEWMKAVDHWIDKLAGVTADDLPDQSYRDWYDDGVGPKDAAMDTILNTTEEIPF